MEKGKRRKYMLAILSLSIFMIYKTPNWFFQQKTTTDKLRWRLALFNVSKKKPCKKPKERKFENIS